MVRFQIIRNFNWNIGMRTVQSGTFQSELKRRGAEPSRHWNEDPFQSKDVSLRVFSVWEVSVPERFSSASLYHSVPFYVGGVTLNLTTV